MNHNWSQVTFCLLDATWYSQQLLLTLLLCSRFLQYILYVRIAIVDIKLYILFLIFHNTIASSSLSIFKSLRLVLLFGFYKSSRWTFSKSMRVTGKHLKWRFICTLVVRCVQLYSGCFPAIWSSLGFLRVLSRLVKHESMSNLHLFPGQFTWCIPCFLQNCLDSFDLKDTPWPLLSPSGSPWFFHKNFQPLHSPMRCNASASFLNDKLCEIINCD